MSQREQADVIDSWLDERIINLLPQLMTGTDIDKWVMVSRENNEDPVIRTMLPATWMVARRRTILVIYQLLPNAFVETMLAPVMMWEMPLKEPGIRKLN